MSRGLCDLRSGRQLHRQVGGGGNYTTIQACADALSPGDTCTVYAGTYNEHVTLGAGSAGNYKTLTVNAGDTVDVLSFTVGFYDKVNGYFSGARSRNPSDDGCIQRFRLGNIARRR